MNFCEGAMHNADPCLKPYERRSRPHQEGVRNKNGFPKVTKYDARWQEEDAHFHQGILEPQASLRIKVQKAW
jgi:hypothetical protein